MHSSSHAGRGAAIILCCSVLGLGRAPGELTLDPEPTKVTKPKNDLNPAVAPPPKVEPLRLKLELADGSLVIGVPAVQVLPLKTSYSDMQVPVGHIRSVDFSQDHATLIILLANGDRLTTATKLTAFRLVTLFGDVTVPLAFIKRLTIISGGHTAAIRDGLILSFSFEIVTGANVADESQHGHTGVLCKGAKIVNEPRRGNVLELDGHKAHVHVPSSPDFRLTNATVCVWLKPDSWHIPTDNIQSVFSTCTPVNHEGGIMIGLGGDRRLLWMYRPAGDTPVAIGTPLGLEAGDDQWHFLAVTFDCADGQYAVRVYSDARLVRERIAPSEIMNYCGQALDLGIRFDGATDDTGGPDSPCPYKGRMDNLMLFNRALSEQEILASYHATK